MKFESLYQNHALKEACKHGQLNIVKSLISRLNHEVDLYNCLFDALYHNHYDVVKYLLDCKPFKNEKEHHELIKHICAQGNLELFSSMLSHRDIIENHQILIEDTSYLKIVLQCNYHDILKYLLFDFNIHLDDKIIQEIENKNKNNYCDENSMIQSLKLLEMKKLKMRPI